MTRLSDRDGASTIFEEAESISIGEVMKSPIFSEDESSDNSHWIDLGQSPFGSDLYRRSSPPGRPAGLLQVTSEPSEREREDLGLGKF
ncbi:hypothetical protein TB2_046921 [Malus domestica]